MMWCLPGLNSNWFTIQYIVVCFPHVESFWLIIERSSYPRLRTLERRNKLCIYTPQTLWCHNKSHSSFTVVSDEGIQLHLFLPDDSSQNDQQFPSSDTPCFPLTLELSTLHSVSFHSSPSIVEWFWHNAWLSCLYVEHQERGSIAATILGTSSWIYVTCLGLGGLVVRPPQLWRRFQRKWSFQREPCWHRPVRWSRS